LAIAGNISLVTVTGQYVDYLGNPIAGQIIFTLPKTLRNELADQIMIPSSFAADIDAFGQFTVTLPSTDDPDFHESFVYTVTEAFAGGRSFQVTLPLATPNVKMSSLVPVYSGESYTELAAYQAYVVEEQAVTAQEALISLSPAGVKMPTTYGSLLVTEQSFTSVAAAFPSYTGLLSATNLVATSSDVTPFGTTRLNLLTNPSVELALTGWNTLPGSTIARVTTGGYAGPAAVQVTRGTTSNNQGISGTVAVVSGQQYTFSAYLRNTAGITRNMYAQIGWPGGTFSTSTITAIAAADGWVRLAATGTAPSSGTAALYVVTGTTAQNASGQTALIDALLMEQSATAGSYFDGSKDGFWTGDAHTSTSRNATAISAEIIAEAAADLAIEQAEELFPHPFVFTGSLGVQR
jgi:hypothetical protein